MSKSIRLTKDQSLVQQLIDAGQIQPEEAETHTLKNVILQALGAQNEIYPVAARLDTAARRHSAVVQRRFIQQNHAADMQEILIENLKNWNRLAWISSKKPTNAAAKII